MATIWTKGPLSHREGKYLVVRRDGTVPDWEHFVLGGLDPSTPAALRAYAADAVSRGEDMSYCASVLELAFDIEFRQSRTKMLASALNTAAKAADPSAGPHRRDLPLVIAMMRRNFDLKDVSDRLFTVGNMAAGNMAWPRMSRDDATASANVMAPEDDSGRR